MPNKKPPAWWPNWRGQTCMIVASGPSASTVPVDIAKGKVRCIAVNSSWRLAPWADMLYGTDAAFWNQYRGVPDFGGLKVTSDVRAAEMWEIGHVRCRRPVDVILMDKMGEIGWGGNSGFHCINLAFQFKVAKIILVGFDMHLNGGIHWHGDHPGGMHNPIPGNVTRWCRAVDGAAEPARRHGIKIINCSMESALQNYEKMPLERALQ